MKTEWDYTELADAYLARPPYAREALEEIFETAALHEGSRVCDIGAGVGHLRRFLISPERGWRAHCDRTSAAPVQISRAAS